VKATMPLVTLALLLALAPPARAVIGTIDVVPAATLLLPYFEVDLDDPQGVTTLFSVDNAAAGPAVVHVTLWSDLGVATLSFNMYLTGYDVLTFDLGQMFRAGAVPVTDDDTPVGAFSTTTNPDTGVGPGAPGCADFLPVGPMPQVYLDHIRAAHTGHGSPIIFSGSCAGLDHGDNVARGFITFDSASRCGLAGPGDQGYFVSGGQGVANNDNVLLGDFALIDRSTGASWGSPMVHVEASNALGPGDYTFYRRLAGSGQDQREGLGTSFWARYGFGATDLIVWRDPQQRIQPFSCAAGAPAPFPLSQTQIVAFDEEETPSVLSPGLNPFPAVSNSVAAGPLAASPFGWMYLNLNAAVPGSQVPFNPTLQNWVMVRIDLAGELRVGYDAFQLDNVLAPRDESLPICDGDPDPVGCTGITGPAPPPRRGAGLRSLQGQRRPR
jgi:hypothetical protein